MSLRGRGPRSKGPHSASASTKSSNSPVPSLPPTMANRRRQDDGDEVDDAKARNKRPQKEAPKSKSKVVEELPMPYSNHDDDEEGSVTRCVCGSGAYLLFIYSLADWRRRGGHGQLYDPVRAVLCVAARCVHGCCQCRREPRALLLRAMQA